MLLGSVPLSLLYDTSNKLHGKHQKALSMRTQHQQSSLARVTRNAHLTCTMPPTEFGMAPVSMLFFTMNFLGHTAISERRERGEAHMALSSDPCCSLTIATASCRYQREGIPTVRLHASPVPFKYNIIAFSATIRLHLQTSSEAVTEVPQVTQRADGGWNAARQ